METKVKKEALTPETYTTYDYSKVKRYIKELAVLRGWDNKKVSEVIKPLYRLYLKAMGKFTPK